MTQHGWVSQNVESYEIMLANGTHVTASGTENPDLYFSVKTGNNNFGIVSHLNFKTYPIADKVWGGAVTYSTKYSADFMAAIAEYQLNGQKDTNSALLPYIAVGNDTILATFSYLDGIDNPDAFAPFYRIPNTSDTTQVLNSFYELASGSLPSLPRLRSSFTYAATSLYLDKDAYLGILNITEQFNSRVQQILSGTLVLMVQPISEAMIEQSQRKGHNPLDSIVFKPQLCKLLEAYRPQDYFLRLLTNGSLTGASINIGWSLESDDQFVFEVLEECITTIESFTKAKKVFDPFIFINDAAPFQRPLQEYGENTFQKLRSTSYKYDPAGVFQSLVPGGFKVLS
ncbi:hypothetical protein RRF57_001570 [Xylaria bambusicola]|uniref:Berberine/berberine-like domain-containing protein n=1 Tax=Xylaria bambusicola TaxID=326684 RepID=A0AAN7UBQ1_9PEZI